MKKFLSILLALSMLLSLSAASFAEGETAEAPAAEAPATEAQTTEAQTAAMLNELFGTDAVKEEDVAEFLNSLGNLFGTDTAEKTVRVFQVLFDRK